MKNHSVEEESQGFAFVLSKMNYEYGWVIENFNFLVWNVKNLLLINRKIIKSMVFRLTFETI